MKKKTYSSGIILFATRSFFDMLKQFLAPEGLSAEYVQVSFM